MPGVKKVDQCKSLKSTGDMNLSDVVIRSRTRKWVSEFVDRLLSLVNLLLVGLRRSQEALGAMLAVQELGRQHVFMGDHCLTGKAQQLAGRLEVGIEGHSVVEYKARSVVVLAAAFLKVL